MTLRQDAAYAVHVGDRISDGDYGYDGEPAIEAMDLVTSVEQQSYKMRFGVKSRAFISGLIINGCTPLWIECSHEETR